MGSEGHTQSHVQALAPHRELVICIITFHTEKYLPHAYIERHTRQTYTSTHEIHVLTFT